MKIKKIIQETILLEMDQDAFESIRSMLNRYVRTKHYGKTLINLINVLEESSIDLDMELQYIAQHSNQLYKDLQAYREAKKKYNLQSSGIGLKGQFDKSGDKFVVGLEPSRNGLNIMLAKSGSMKDSINVSYTISEKEDNFLEKLDELVQRFYSLNVNPNFLKGLGGSESLQKVIYRIISEEFDLKEG